MALAKLLALLMSTRVASATVGPYESEASINVNTSSLAPYLAPIHVQKRRVIAHPSASGSDGCIHHAQPLPIYTCLPSPLRQQYPTQGNGAHNGSQTTAGHSPIRTGAFMLVSARNRDLCLDDGGGNSNGATTAKLWRCDAMNNNQIFGWDGGEQMRPLQPTARLLDHFLWACVIHVLRAHSNCSISLMGVCLRVPYFAWRRSVHDEPGAWQPA